MRKTLYFLVLACAFLPPSALASSYKIKIENIDCENCVDRIYDFFDKIYGKQAQHVKVDLEKHRVTVTYESISMDFDVVKDQLETIGFNIDGSSRDLRPNSRSRTSR